jgi:hypothetical protein
MCDLIFSGVFKRHPRLTLAIVEFELAWAPHVLSTMDYTYRERHGEAIYRFKNGVLPSDFFRRNVVEFSVTRERFRPAGTSADRDCSRSSPASRCRTSHGPAGFTSEAHGLQMSRIPPRAPSPNGIARGRRCRLRSKFAADSLLEGAVTSEPMDCYRPTLGK